MLIAFVFTWVVIIGLAVAVLALMRQIGLLHDRVAPIGALVLQNALEPGEVAPTLSVTSLAGKPLSIGGARPGASLQLLLFVSPSCPICKTLLPTAKVFAAAEALDLLLIGDGDWEEHRRMASSFAIPHERFAVSREAGLSYRVGKLPHAVLIDPTGLVAAQGLVNSREHLESLIVSHESGVKTVQQFLSGRKHVEQVG